MKDKLLYKIFNNKITYINRVLTEYNLMILHILNRLIKYTIYILSHKEW